jgi:branched-chain amino acid transport system permease protein
MNVIVSQLIINILITASIYLLIGLSFYLMFYVTRVFHVFHAALITAGAYFTYLFAIRCQFPLLLSIVLSLALTVIVGITGETCVFTPLRKKKLPTLAFLIASIGMYIILENVISICFGSNTKVLKPGEGIAGYPVFGAYVTAVQITTIVAAVVICEGTHLFLHYTRYGRSMRAVASNPALSNIYGINSTRVIILAMGVSAMLAAIAGILLALDTSITPTFGFNALMYGVAAMMIGGLGNNLGIIGGSLMLSASQHLVAFFLGASWSAPVGYIVLILFLLWKPLGFSGHKIKKIEI